MKHLERHLFVSDFQIPDHNKPALHALLRFIPDFSPDHLHLMGDFLNFTKASDFVSVGEVPTLGQEIKTGRAVLHDLVETARTANPRVKIIWYLGNHEYRLEKFLAKADNVLTDIEDEFGETLVSIEHIFNLKALGIELIPYYGTHRIGDAVIEHGHIARSKAGFTAQAQIEKYGKSGFSGHTHKLSFVARKQFDDVKFWIETGSFCNPEPSPVWAKKPDWVNGFAVGIHDVKEDILHPIPIIMQKNQFYWEGKIYRG